MSDNTWWYDSRLLVCLLVFAWVCWCVLGSAGMGLGLLVVCLNPNSSTPASSPLRVCFLSPSCSCTRLLSLHCLAFTGYGGGLYVSMDGALFFDVSVALSSVSAFNNYAGAARPRRTPVSLRQHTTAETRSPVRLRCKHGPWACRVLCTRRAGFIGAGAYVAIGTDNFAGSVHRTRVTFTAVNATANKANWGGGGLAASLCGTNISGSAIAFLNFTGAGNSAGQGENHMSRRRF